MPGLKLDKFEDNNAQKEIKNGYAVVATINANDASGLNWKKSVFEKGNDNDEIIPEPASQTGRTPKISKYGGRKLLNDFNFKYREIPIIPPILQNSIPVIRVK